MKLQINTMPTAKVFRIGNLQAVRIPKGFRVDASTREFERVRGLKIENRGPAANFAALE